MKRIISFFALLSLSILLVSCKTDTKKNVVENLNITNDILTFDKIEGALSYNIYVNDSKHEAFENRYNLSLLDLSVGLYDVTVTSVVNDKESAHSEVIVYEVKAVIETEKLSDEDKNSLLKTLDKEFSLNMSKEDFLDESAYYSYLNALRVVNNYDLYYPLINMLSNASDYITQSTKGIVEMLFDNMITTEYTNYTEAELNEMKTLMISQIDEFDRDVKVLNELDYKNLTDNDKLLIDDFFYNYFNFGGGSLNIA